MEPLTTWLSSLPGNQHPGFGHEGLDHRPLHMCSPQPEMPLGVWKSPPTGRCDSMSCRVKEAFCYALPTARNQRFLPDTHTPYKTFRYWQTSVYMFTFPLRHKGCLLNYPKHSARLLARMFASHAGTYNCVPRPHWVFRRHCLPCSS